MPDPQSSSRLVHRRLLWIALVGLLVLASVVGSPALLADPPGEGDPPPPPMTESHVSAEAEAAAAVAAIQPVLREARALQDRMPPNVAGRVQTMFTAEHFQRYADRVVYRRERAEQSMESRRDGNLTESELEVELAKLELNAYETVFDAQRDRLLLEGAVLSATLGRADWWVGAWSSGRSAEDIEKEKQQLTALIALAEQLAGVRERAVQEQDQLRVKMMRVVQRVEAHDEAEAEEMAYEVGRRFRESYIDHSIERPTQGEFNRQLRTCKVWGPRDQSMLHYVDAFTAPNLLARARWRLRLLEEGRTPRRRASVSIVDAHGTAHDGRVVSPGMTLEAVYENEGALLPRQTLTVEHYRDDAPVGFSAHPLLYMDPQRVQDEGYARLVGRRGDVHLDSLYVSNKILFITENELESDQVGIANAKRWLVVVVKPGDVVRIVGEGLPTLTLGVEAAQPEVRLIDVATDEIVPLEALQYGVSYKLEVVFGQRQNTSDLRYEIAWGEGRNQSKPVEMAAVPSSDPDVAATQRRDGYTQFRSNRPIVFDDLSPLTRPRRER